MSHDIVKSYDAFYSRRDPERVYPVEFVVRAFLGAYPRLKSARSEYADARVLDLGFGDGRNMPFLADLGMSVHGAEISAEICDRAKARMTRADVSADLRVGRNDSIPFADGYFDIVLACHACYYVDRGSSFRRNIEEIARVTKPGGRFVFSAPMGTSYIMRGARDLGGGAMEIAHDPYGVRVGAILQKFDSEAEIERALSPHFEDLQAGSCRNDWWGVEEHVWIGSCRRATGATTGKRLTP